MTDISETNIDCLNCGSVFQGSFCHQCGQKKSAPISLQRLYKDVIDQLSELDFSFWHTLRDLIKSPGKMVDAYLKGRRKYYTSPIRFSFIFVTIWVIFALSFIFTEQTISQPEILQGTRNGIGFISYVMYIFIFPVAWIQSKLLSKNQYSLIECYVFLLYQYAIWSLITLVCSIPLMFFMEPIPMLGLINIPKFFWFIYALKSFHNHGWSRTIFSSLLIFISYIVISMLTLSSLSFMTMIVSS